MSRERAEFIYLALVSMACLSLVLNGCATANKSVGLGGAVGAGSGALLVGIVDPGKNGEYRTRNVIVGGALGAMAGMVAGSALFEHTEKEKRDAFLKGQSAATLQRPGAAPTLRQAQYKSDWIEGRAVGQNRWVDGHFEYVITEPARFESGQ
jgi:hypothetical protein